MNAGVAADQLRASRGACSFVAPVTPQRALSIAEATMRPYNIDARTSDGFRFSFEPWSGSRRRGGETRLIGRIRIAPVDDARCRIIVALRSSTLTRLNVLVTLGGSFLLLLVVARDAQLRWWLLPVLLPVCGIVIWGWRRWAGVRESALEALALRLRQRMSGQGNRGPGREAHAKQSVAAR